MPLGRIAFFQPQTKPNKMHPLSTEGLVTAGELLVKEPLHISNANSYFTVLGQNSKVVCYIPPNASGRRLNTQDSPPLLSEPPGWGRGIGFGLGWISVGKHQGDVRKRMTSSRNEPFTQYKRPKYKMIFRLIYICCLSLSQNLWYSKSPKL